MHSLLRSKDPCLFNHQCQYYLLNAAGCALTCIVPTLVSLANSPCHMKEVGGGDGIAARALEAW